MPFIFRPRSQTRVKPLRRRRLLLHARNVRPADRVPGHDVLLHALADAALLLARRRRAGLGHAPLEAVLVDFLSPGRRVSIHAKFRE